MTSFESYLVENGFIRYRIDTEANTYKQEERYFLSTLGNLNYRYIHKDNSVMMDLIDRAVDITSDEFRTADRGLEIIFGLETYGCPPHIVSPKPNVKRNTYTSPMPSDAILMSRLLDEVEYDEILRAMKDPSIHLDLPY